MRTLFDLFTTHNPVYRGATVTFYTVSNGVKTTTKATLYASESGTTTLQNPQHLDSSGMLKQPVYHDENIIASVTGLTVADHDTPVVRALINQIGNANPRGTWQTSEQYVVNDMVEQGSSGYICVTAHTSGVFATDLAAGKWQSLGLLQSVHAQYFSGVHLETIAALKSVDIQVAGQHALVAGYYAAGDGGGGLFYWDAASTATDDGGMVIALNGGGTGRWKRITEDIYVEHFGAKGDNSTVNDTAFANARAATIHAGKALHLGPGTFRISSSFDIGQYTGWAIKGDTRGGTIIRQVTDNTPIIKITGNTSWGWSITDVAFDWVNAQPSTNTGAIGVYCDGTTASQQVFHFLLDRVTFDKGYLALASNSSKQLAVWGFEIGQMLVNSSMSGGAIRLTQSVSWGQPSILIRQLYARCDSMTLPVAEINAANGLVINSIEGNILPNIALLKLTTCIGAHIGEAKIELATYTSSDSRAIEYSNCDVHIGSLILGLSTIAVGAGNEFYALYQAGGAAGRIKIDTMQCNVATLTSGKAYVVRSSNAANQVVIGRITSMTNFELTDTSATSGADGLTVESWANQLVSADKGDANVTFTMGDECIVRFGTTLTANRDFTLPVANTAVGACSCFNGHRVTVLRDAATPGAFTLTIKNSAGATLYTIPSGTKQAVDLVWSRVSGGAYRVLRAVTLT